MKILTSASEIRQSVRNLNPKRIAVGYVGVGWKNYVSEHDLKEIIVSPKFGSNPKAIRDIMDKIGHDNVYLLENLHSKVYLGDSIAVLGSCNLSDNGFSENGLEETAVEFHDEGMRDALEKKFNEYKAEAHSRLPTYEAKDNRLKILEQECKEAKRAGLLGTTRGLSLKNFEMGAMRIHIVWYEFGDTPMNEGKIRNELGLGGDVDLDEVFSEYLQFAESDDVRRGDWLLTWRCKKNGLPAGRKKIAWMRVDHVESAGFIDGNYPKFVGEFADGFGDVIPSPEPFHLDEKTKAGIVKLLSSNDYARLRGNDDCKWELPEGRTLIRKFIADLKADV